MISQRARQAREERGKGVPLTDSERAARHYDISVEEYLDNPELYPLPERGTGLAGIGVLRSRAIGQIEPTAPSIMPQIVFFGGMLLLVGAILKKMDRRV